VTRLGFFGFNFLITKVGHIFGYFLHGTTYVLIFYKKMFFCHILGYFFTNLSSHPELLTANKTFRESNSVMMQLLKTSLLLLLHRQENKKKII
jgi:hypothetical protein